MPQGNDDATVAARQVLDGSHMVIRRLPVPPAVLKQAVTQARASSRWSIPAAAAGPR